MHRTPEPDTSKLFSSAQYNVYFEKNFLIPRYASGFSNGLKVTFVSSDGVYQK